MDVCEVSALALWLVDIEVVLGLFNVEKVV